MAAVSDLHLQMVETQASHVNEMLLVSGAAQASLEKQRNRASCLPSLGLPVTEDR